MPFASGVIGLPHEDRGNIRYAIVELSAPASDEHLMAHLRQRLPAQTAPDDRARHHAAA